MRSSFFALLAATAFVAPAQATTVLFDNFDNEAGGTTVLNYSGFANFDVTDGTVDILRQPNGFGLTCAGGAGSSCVDLDGSTNDGGRLVTKTAYAFNAGDTIRLALDISGSQRGDLNGWRLGFLSGGGAISFVNFFGGGPLYGTTLPISGTGTGASVFSSISSSTPYTQIFATFRAGNSGTLKAYVDTGSADNIGPIIDNFSLIVAVPEPASWALMIAGFGLVGGAMRRRTRVAYVTA